MRGPGRNDIHASTTGEGREAMAGSGITRPTLRVTGLALGLAALFAAYAVVDPPPSAPVAPVMTPVAEENPVRQTERDAVAYAAKIDTRVEIAGYREETVSVFANPDGTRSTLTYAQPVRVVRDGEWVPTDATLTRASDGTIGPKAAAFGLQLSGGGNGPLLTAIRAGRSMSLDWPGTLPKPSLDDDRATYAEVLPGVDLVVNVGVTEFSHVLVIKNAEAARNPELATLDFGLKTDGLDVQSTDDGGLEAVDVAAGGAVFEAGTPTMWDSGEQASTPAGKPRAMAVDPKPQDAVEAAPDTAKQVDLGLTLTDDKITLVPDQQMLTSPQTNFPVYVDPLWTDKRASSWAMVASGYPAQEYWKFKGDEGVGECPVSSGDCAGTGRKRIYYTLPTSFPDRKILKVELGVTMTKTYDSSKKNVSAYLSKSGISKSTNWDNKPDLGAKLGTQDSNGTRGSCEKDNQNVWFDVKAAVSGKRATTTFALRADDESDSSAWKRFCGNAILSVQWNRPPYTPKQKDLKSAGSCKAGAERPFTDSQPVLSATLSDPDVLKPYKEPLIAQFKIYWTPAGGAQVIKTYDTGEKASGSKFTLDTGDIKGLTFPQHTVIAWEVRARDLGNAWSEWSSYGSQTQCEFVVDKTSPIPPDIDSSVYLPLDASENTGKCEPDETAPEDGTDRTSATTRGWIGRYGTFTFDSAATDVVAYEYGFNSDPSPANTLTPTTDGGPVSVTWMPTTEGEQTVNVKAKDRAGKTSTEATCVFFVATRLSAGSWTMADTGPGAADVRGRSPAKAGAGVTFGVPGPACRTTVKRCAIDRAVRLTGSADSYLATATSALIDTGAPAEGYSVSAWVRLTDLSGDRVAVSQDGTGESGFALGFDGASKKWTFTSAASPVDTLGGWTSSSKAPAEKDKWTHLAGVVDPVQATMQLFVNGVPQPIASKRSGWKSFGAVQFGRRYSKGGHDAFWAGDLAEVNVFDRIIVEHEVKTLAWQRPERVAYWPLDDQVGSQADAYDDPDGPALELTGGAAVRTVDLDDPGLLNFPLVGSGELILDGINDHAATAGPVATTTGSFTVSARVRLATSRCSRTMAVVSQSGLREGGFTIRCSAANRWEVVLPQLDGTDAKKPPVILASDIAPSGDSAGQQLVLVYDDETNEARLYVNGQLTDSATRTFTSTWAAAGPLNIGRALEKATFGGYFSGVVDDVRVYGGAVDAETVISLGSTMPDPEL